MSHRHTLTLSLLLAGLSLSVGCKYDEDRDRVTMQSTTQPADTQPATQPGGDGAQTQPAADAAADDLAAELVQAVQDQLATHDAQLGTNSIRDLEAIVREGVDRLKQDGMKKKGIATARENAKRWADKTAEIAGESVRSNITRVELMAALSQLSPLYPFVTEKVSPAVPPQPGTPIDPVD